MKFIKWVVRLVKDFLLERAYRRKLKQFGIAKKKKDPFIYK